MPTSAHRPSKARDRLLGAARELFYAEGCGVSVDAIVEHADVAKPTVYAHFESKDALIDGVLRAVSDQWFADVDAELERRRGDARGRLLAPFDVLARGLPDPTYHGCILLNSAATFLSPAHPAHRALEDHQRRMRELFERLAAEAGSARPAELARQLTLLYAGVKAQGLVDCSDEAARDARAAAAALLALQAREATLKHVTEA
jgi:AcrR family transcriptional regulator